MIQRPVKSWTSRIALAVAVVAFCFSPHSHADPSADRFHKEIEPLLAQYCTDCHGEGVSKGNVTLDASESEESLLKDHDLWWRALKNVRAGTMPPPKKPRPSEAELQKLTEWIKYGALGIDPAHPDPGRVTLRRLNRVEYRNTIRDLMDVDFNTTEEFPSDDTGYGFDTIGDVLSVSPLLLEKYMQAAERIVTQAVPVVARAVAETTIGGRDFRARDGKPSGNGSGRSPRRPAGSERMSFYNPANVSAVFRAGQAGSYRLNLQLKVHGAFDFDPGKCKFALTVDDEPAWDREFSWDAGKAFDIVVPFTFKAGDHRLEFSLTPLTAPDLKKTSVEMEVAAVRVEGPLEEPFWLPTKNHDRFFAHGQAPADPAARRQYARETIAAFAKKAFRRPADERTIDRLVAIAEAGYSLPGKSFEQGVARAMVAVLSSPRFLFRVERSDMGSAGEAASPIDEYSLAGRLSYFLWSTMPDDELTALADKHELRKNLPAQVKRLLGDPRSAAFVENFTGQWLQARDVEGVSIDARLVHARDTGKEKEMQAELEAFRQRLAEREAALKAAALAGTPLPPFKKPKFFSEDVPQLDRDLRTAMRAEPEMLFSYIVREDRSVLDLLNCDYTFLNERLAKHYGIPGVSGKEMRRVDLPKDSPRGGLLTTGAVLVVTSNPTRTSPVKRGIFVLDNILGTPALPAPADIPPLEEAEKTFKDREPTLREMLAVHRDNALCRSCHARMDPLGLGFENFNAMGQWRDKERNQPIEAAGTLATGEEFHDPRELKQVLRRDHATDFYRCLTEKVLTYALGRGMEASDTEAVDRIVERMQKSDGKFSSLLTGVIESSPFQMRRNTPAVEAGKRASR